MLKIKQEDVMKKFKNLKVVSIIGIVCISLLIYLLYPVINQEIKKYQTKETFINLAKDWLNEAKRIEIKKDYKQSMSSMDFTNQLLSEIYPNLEIEIIDKKEENHLYGDDCEKVKSKICIFQVRNIDEVNIVTGLLEIEKIVLKNDNNMYVTYSGPFSDNNVIRNSRFQINVHMYPDKMELSVEDLATALAAYYSEDQGISELNYIKNKGVYLDKYGNNQYEQDKNDFIVGYVFKHLKITE